MIRPHLRSMINDHKTSMRLPINKTTSGEWKNQLIMLNKCISIKIFEETCPVYSPSENIEILMGSETNDIIDELFKSLLQRFQDAKEQSNDKGSEFVHESVGLLYYKLQKISLKRGKSYIDSPEWLKNKRAAIDPKNKTDDKCFQYALLVTLHHQNIGRDPQRISKIEPIINQYNWKGIDSKLFQKDWKKFRQNNKTIALNIL